MLIEHPNGALAGDHLGTGFGEDEGLFCFGPRDGGVPGKGLARSYLLECLRGRNDLTRGVASHAALMVQLPLVGKPRFSVEAPAVGEDVGQGSSGPGGLPHAPQDGFADFLSPFQLLIGFLEVDHPCDVGVEPAALRAHDEHGPALKRVAVWDRVAVTGDSVVRGGQQDGAEELSPAAGRCQVGRRLVLAHPRFERARGFGYCRGGVGSDPPVALQGVWVEYVTQGGDLLRDVGCGAVEREVSPERNIADDIPDGRDLVFVLGVLDHLEAGSLLLLHALGLDVVGEDVLRVAGEDDVSDAQRARVVHPVIRPARVPGEVGRTAQQERSQISPLHQLPKPLLSRAPALLTTVFVHSITSAPVFVLEGADNVETTIPRSTLRWSRTGCSAIPPASGARRWRHGAPCKEPCPSWLSGSSPSPRHLLSQAPRIRVSGGCRRPPRPSSCRGARPPPAPLPRGSSASWQRERSGPARAPPARSTLLCQAAGL